MSETVHATAVLAGAVGILIRGASGSGKSMLGLALIQRGGGLIADDRVLLSSCHGRIVATAAAGIRGRIELRGRGILEFPWEESAVIRLVVDMCDAEAIDRLPEPEALTDTLLGVALPRQPAPSNCNLALPLIDAALSALSADHDMHLQTSGVWGR